jgi:hypothetical protein
MEDMQPGQVILPNPPNSAPQPPVGAPEPERPQEGGTTVPTPPEGDTAARMVMAPPQPESLPTEPSYYKPAAAAQQAEWQYSQESNPSLAPDTPNVQDVAWTATEFILHPKGAEWYSGFAGATFVLTVIVYLLTTDTFSAGVVIFMAVLFGVYAARKPRMQQYGLDLRGLHVGRKTYSFHEFKSFSVSEESSIASIILMPLKRFMPPLTIYVSTEAEETVVSVLGQYLPFEPHKADAIDNLLRRIRF